MGFMDIIRTILTSDAGSFAFVVGLLLLAAWVLITVTKAKTQWEDRKEGLDKLENRVGEIMSNIHYIKATLGVMQNLQGGLVQSHSPVSLTLKGKEVASEMGIEAIISKNWERIQDAIEKSNAGTNAYDIQQFCIETATISLDTFFSLEDVNKIKSYAYTHGKPLAYYGGMIGVLIRDKFFEIKGIPIEEVDAAKSETTA